MVVKYVKVVGQANVDRWIKRRMLDLTKDEIINNFEKEGKMTLNEYQEKAMTTAQYAEKWAIIYPALKLSGEAGEVSEKVGKVLRDKDGIFTEEIKLELAKELGDVMWYIAALAKAFGYSLEEIAEMNIAKLASRKERNVISGNGDNR